MTFRQYIDECFMLEIPLVIWGPTRRPDGTRGIQEGVVFIVVRLATKEEADKSEAALAGAGFVFEDDLGQVPHLFRLDSLLGQLEAETAHDEPATRPATFEPAEVEELTRAQRQLAVLDYLRTDGLAARLRDPHPDGGQFARDIEAFLAEISDPSDRAMLEGFGEVE